jgi:tetratricopeptide (TPR) repeat protein
MGVQFIELLLLAICVITLSPSGCHGWSSFTSGAAVIPRWGTERTPPILPSADHQDSQRRAFVVTVTAATFMATFIVPGASSAAESKVPSAATLVADRDADSSSSAPVLVSLSGDAKKLFNEGRALESQGNIAAAQRLYAKVTQMAPRFVYGWSNLGNTQTAFGNLDAAEASYTTAVDLCLANLATTESIIGIPRCSDLYVLLLNRGSLRLNNGRPQDALQDLRQSEQLRGRPDAIVLQNLARALEINGLYSQADRDYTTAISMTSNEVSPFWLRSALVKYQLGDVKGGFDLLKRVAQRFPEAPEVRAAYAVFLSATGDATAAQQKFLELPDRQRLKYTDTTYLTQTISWPPTMIQQLKTITTAVGDNRGRSS